MAVWVVRGGEEGQFVEENLARNAVSINWEVTNDIHNASTKEDVKRILKVVYPNGNNIVMGKHAGEVWDFKEIISVGGLVVRQCSIDG